MPPPEPVLNPVEESQVFLPGNRNRPRLVCVASTITQLSKVVPSPALQLAVVENGAVVLITSPNGNGCSARAEVNRGA